MQNLIGINRVDLANKRLVRRNTELVRFDRDGILPKGNELVAFRGEIDTKLAYLDY